MFGSKKYTSKYMMLSKIAKQVALSLQHERIMLALSLRLTTTSSSNHWVGLMHLNFSAEGLFTTRRTRDALRSLRKLLHI